jgi:hypothetical protein
MLPPMIFSTSSRGKPSQVIDESERVLHPLGMRPVRTEDDPIRADQLDVVGEIVFPERADLDAALECLGSSMNALGIFF